MRFGNIVVPSNELSQQSGSTRKLANVAGLFSADLRGKRDASADSMVWSSFCLISIESTLTKNRPVTLLQSTLTKTLDLKSSRINTYKKSGGEGVRMHPLPEAKSPACRPRQGALRSIRRASPVREVAKSPLRRPRLIAAKSPGKGSFATQNNPLRSGRRASPVRALS